MVISTKTDYDENTNYFDTSSEKVIEQVIKSQSEACIGVSLLSIGFVDRVRNKHKMYPSFFHKFLREGHAA